jgi:hypothetical protein
MNGDEHDTGVLAGHALTALDADDRISLEEHLIGCARCRRELAELQESAQLLEELPPEALLDGPPQGGDLLLRRTLQQVRAESDRSALRRRAATCVAAVALIAAGTVGGALASGDQETPSVTSPAPSAEPTTVPTPEGSRVGTSTDPNTRARMTVRMTPAAGWVRVNAAVSGIPEGQACQLWVVSSDGTRQLAGSWLVSEEGAVEGTTLDGTALVAPEDVSAIEVENVDGDHFVSVQL